LILGGIDQIRDLVHPRTPLFAVLEPVEIEDRFLVSTYDVSLLVHNESDDSVVVEDMACFRSFTADEEDLNFLDSIWVNDTSSIISPGTYKQLIVSWRGSGDLVGPDDRRSIEPLPRGVRTVRRWNSTCGACPDRDMSETIDIPITICRLYFRTSRNTEEIYDFPATYIDGQMGRMIHEREHSPVEVPSVEPLNQDQPF
jgi:hypothetical protein